jgi:hypothetical protein
MRFPTENPAMEEKLDFAAYFAGGLLNPHREIPECVSDPRGKSAERRYNIYRNNVIVSLIDALAAIFPATLRITGPEFFRAMARFHIRATPPSSPLLFEYGHDFPAFIERYEYARDMPWLADVARLERAWLDAYHAADEPPLAKEALSQVPPELLGCLRFRRHPAARLVCSNYPVVDIFNANRSDAAVGKIAAATAQSALITRPAFDVELRGLPKDAEVFLSRLLEGGSLEVAAASAFEVSSEFDLASTISMMIEAGVFTATFPGEVQHGY